MSEETMPGGDNEIEMIEATEKVVMSAIDDLEVERVEASLSAIASVTTDSLSATGSAVGMAKVGGDARAQLSVVGLVAASGNAELHQSYASAFVAGDTMSVSQAAVPMGLARTITFEQSGALVSAAGETTVKRSFVGLLLSGRTEVSEDSKVLLSTRAALIIAAALLGGFGFVAIAIYLGARRVSQWRPSISLPSMRELPSLKDLPAFAQRFKR